MEDINTGPVDGTEKRHRLPELMFPDTLAEALEAFSGASLDPAMIDLSHWRRVVEVASAFPAQITSLVGLECRLGDPVPGADLLFCATVAEWEAGLVAASTPARPAAWVHSSTEPWQRVHELCRRWTADAEWRARVWNIWLEFDVGPKGAAEPEPSLFVGPHIGQLTAASDPADIMWWLGGPIATMSGGLLPAGVAFATQRAVRSLPANAEVFQVGRMLARGTEAMRLCVRGLEVADVVPLLERLQWSGDTVALGALLHSLGERTASINLALDVDEGVRPGIGLECRLPSDPDSANAFLDSLEVSGLATREKRAALDRFPGVSVPARDDTPWPAHLTRAAAFLGPGYLSVCRRWVHHIKLVFDGRAVTAAKAYLALGHTFVTRSRE